MPPAAPGARAVARPLPGHASGTVFLARPLLLCGPPALARVAAARRTRAWQASPPALARVGRRPRGGASRSRDPGGSGLPAAVLPWSRIRAVANSLLAATLAAPPPMPLGGTMFRALRGRARPP